MNFSAEHGYVYKSAKYDHNYTTKTVAFERKNKIFVVC